MTVTIRPLADAELAIADARLPLHRLDAGTGFYLVAWDGREPVGHAYLALTSPLDHARTRSLTACRFSRRSFVVML